MFVALLLGLLLAAPVCAQLSPLDAPKADADKPKPPSNARSKTDLEFYVRHLNVYGPQIEIEVSDFVESEIPGLLMTTVRASYKLASKEHVFYVSKDGKHLVEGTTYEIDKNPFDKANKKINTLVAPAYGKEGASVVVVSFSDFQCPFCAEEAKLLRGQLAEEYGEKVRVYFRDFPLPMHPWAKDASVIGRCIYRDEPEAFWAYHDWIFENQKSITPQNLVSKATAFASSQGVDSLKLTPCIANKETLKQVEESIQEGREVGVTSTPTVFINGRRMTGSLKWERLKGIIDYEIEYQEVTQNAGDDCGCAVDIPFPGQE